MAGDLHLATDGDVAEPSGSGAGEAEYGDSAAGGQVGIADAVLALMRGVVYQSRHARAWEALTRWEAQVRDYVRVMNLDVTVDPVEGYAYLRRRADVPEGTPNLLRRVPLTYRTSLLLVLLRRQLLALDTQGEQTRLVMRRDEIVDLMRTFHPAITDDTRLLKGVDADIARLTEAGFLRAVRGQDDQVEVLRIVKAFVDAEFLTEWPQRLAEYRDLVPQHTGGSDDGSNDEQTGVAS